MPGSPRTRATRSVVGSGPAPSGGPGMGRPLDPSGGSLTRDSAGGRSGGAGGYAGDSTVQGREQREAIEARGIATSPARWAPPYGRQAFCSPQWPCPDDCSLSHGMEGPLRPAPGRAPPKPAPGRAPQVWAPGRVPQGRLLEGPPKAGSWKGPPRPGSWKGPPSPGSWKGPPNPGLLEGPPKARLLEGPLE